MTSIVCKLHKDPFCTLRIESNFNQNSRHYHFHILTHNRICIKVILTSTKTDIRLDRALRRTFFSGGNVCDDTCVAGESYQFLLNKTSGISLYFFLWFCFSQLMPYASHNPLFWARLCPTPKVMIRVHSCSIDSCTIMRKFHSIITLVSE